MTDKCSAPSPCEMAVRLDVRITALEREMKEIKDFNAQAIVTLTKLESASIAMEKAADKVENSHEERLKVHAHWLESLEKEQKSLVAKVTGILMAVAAVATVINFWLRAQ